MIYSTVAYHKTTNLTLMNQLNLARVINFYYLLQLRTIKYIQVFFVLMYDLEQTNWCIYTESSMKQNYLIALTLLACKCVYWVFADNKKIKYPRLPTYVITSLTLKLCRGNFIH